MPEQGRRIYAEQSIRVSTTVDAPLRYVFDWCTDFREDDGKVSRSRPRPRFRVWRLSRDRILRVRLRGGPRRSLQVAVDLIRLNPPRSWHTDQIDETDLAAVDYRLTPLGSRRTRISLTITERWMTPDHPSKTDYSRVVRESWDHYASLIRDRYRSGRPARG